MIKAILYILLLIPAVVFGQFAPPIMSTESSDTGVHFVPAASSALLTFSNNDTKVVSAGGRRVAIANKAVNSGSSQTKVYFYVVIQSGTHPNVGVATSAVDVSAGGSSSLGSDAFGWSYLTHIGASYTNHSNSQVAFGNTYGVGDTVNVAYNATTGHLWFGKNTVWQDSGNPAGGTNQAFTITPLTLVIPAVGEFGGNSFTCQAYFNDIAGMPAGFVTWATR